MEIKYQTDDLLRYTQIVAIPQEYDAASPYDTLYFEFVSPAIVRMNLLAVAGVCAFRQSIEAQLKVERSIDRPVAEAIGRFLHQPGFHISKVDFRPKDPTRMPNIAAVTVKGKTPILEVQNSADRDRSFNFEIHNSAKRVGWSMELPNISVPSNAQLMASAHEKFTLNWWGPFVATVILMADAFQIGTIRLPYMYRDEAKSLRDLLMSIEFKLVVDEYL
ncbi:hypothetical protein I6I68_03645 [Corynebacterium glucuronolyticum]|uniref:hypothetical protein n=1 Tax=Corynebacterium glucuronolyticum TaxID=39791 RepID=UPI00191D3CDE|nr:hypothetical protein [Corynebacterium glucuronolyticum]QQU89076.1 hypothetical protein I6I68_03645 [Corynebacterium glucuronolyticum]